MAPSDSRQSSTALTRYVSESDLANCLRVDRKTVYRLRKRGVLPYLKLGHRIVLFDPVAVTLALEKFAVNGNAELSTAISAKAKG